VFVSLEDDQLVGMCSDVHSVPKLIGAAADTMMSAHGSISDNIIIGYNAYYCIIIDRMGPLMVGGC